MKYELSTTEAAEMLFNDEWANWTRNGSYALVEYLENLEDDLGEEITFCPVVIRCDFTQHHSLEDWALDYWGSTEKANKEIGGADDEKIREFIQDRGQLIEFEGGIIVSSF